LLLKFYTDPCDQPKEAGPCAGNFTRWYFNQKSQTCEQFVYGGCKANDNNFPTEIACHQQCLQPGRRKGTFLFHITVVFYICIKISYILSFSYILSILKLSVYDTIYLYNIYFKIWFKM